MSVNDNNRNGSGGLTTSVVESAEPIGFARADSHAGVNRSNGERGARPRFATRADVKGAEGISKGKLMLLGGGLAVAVLFFVFTAVVGKSPKKPAAVKQAQSQQAKQEQSTPLQRQRDAADGHRAHAGAGQQQRAAWARRHSAHTLAGRWRKSPSHSPASLPSPVLWAACPLSQTRSRSGKIRLPTAELRTQRRRKRSRTV